jgi:hypothetical protein
VIEMGLEVQHVILALISFSNNHPLEKQLVIKSGAIFMTPSMSTPSAIMSHDCVEGVFVDLPYPTSACTVDMRPKGKARSMSNVRKNPSFLGFVLYTLFSCMIVFQSILSISHGLSLSYLDGRKLFK